MPAPLSHSQQVPVPHAVGASPRADHRSFVVDADGDDQADVRSIDYCELAASEDVPSKLEIACALPSPDDVASVVDGIRERLNRVWNVDRSERPVPEDEAVRTLVHAYVRSNDRSWIVDGDGSCDKRPGRIDCNENAASQLKDVPYAVRRTVEANDGRVVVQSRCCCRHSTWNVNSREIIPGPYVSVTPTHGIVPAYYLSLIVNAQSRCVACSGEIQNREIPVCTFLKSTGAEVRELRRLRRSRARTRQGAQTDGGK